jgi:hypothetical protein
MAREITAGVLLKLKDQFSSQIKGAGVSVQGFADKAVGMADKVNSAFSGVAGTLATLGVGIGTAALLKGAIDYQSAITRIATNAGVYGSKVDEFGKRLLQIAYDAKVPEKELIAFANTASESAIGLSEITENMPFMAKVVQGLGISGEEAGQLFTTLFKRGADADTLKEKLNNLAEIGNRLGNMSITQFAKFLPSLSETSGVAVDNIEDVYIALNMLATGTNKPQQALQQYQSAMNDFAKSDTRDAIRRGMGFDVLNEDTGELKSFAEIMKALSGFGEKHGSITFFDKAFHLSDSTIKALKQYNNHYKETIRNVGELGDTSNAITKRADQNAGTIAASLTRLKTAASAFADSTLVKPVEKLADLLNKHPRGMEYAIKGLAAAIATLALLKSFTTVVSFIGSLKELKGGGGGGIPGGLAGAGAGIPVHVTNWGGAAGASMMPKMPGMGTGNSGTGNGNAGIPAQPSLNKGKPIEAARNAVGNISGKQYAMGAAGSGITAAVVKIPQMVNELEAIKQDETLTKKERGKAKGGAIGDATGSIVGAAAGGAAGIAAGAAVGAAVGSVVPVLGTAVGALVGAGIGALGMYLGGKAGRAAGSAIGGAVAGDDEAASPGIAPGKTYGNSYKASRTRRPRQVNKTVTSQGTITAGAVYDEAEAQFSEAAYTGSSVSPGIAPGKTYGNSYKASRTRHSRQVNDLIITPQGQFSTHPDDFIFAMKNPSSLVNNEIKKEIHTVESVPQAKTPVIVEGEIELKSELVIDDKGYKFRQRVGKNTTPYKFAVGSAANARLIQ